MIIAVANQKGGVGKTTIALNLAKGLALKGYKTLLIDNDPQGNLTYYLIGDDVELMANVIGLYDGNSVDPQKVSDNLYLYGADTMLSTVPERGMDAVFGLTEGLKSHISDFEFVIIDCLPGLENLLLASLTAADYALIPLKPAPFAVSGLGDLLKTISKTKSRLNASLEILGLVFNLVDSHRMVMESEIIEEITEFFPEITSGAKVFDTKILKRVKLEESTGKKSSIYDYDKNGFSAKNFRNFVDEFIAVTEAAK